MKTISLSPKYSNLKKNNSSLVFIKLIKYYLSKIGKLKYCIEICKYCILAIKRVCRL